MLIPSAPARAIFGLPATGPTATTVITGSPARGFLLLSPASSGLPATGASLKAFTFGTPATGAHTSDSTAELTTASATAASALPAANGATARSSTTVRLPTSTSSTPTTVP